MLNTLHPCYLMGTYKLEQTKTILISVLRFLSFSSSRLYTFSVNCTVCTLVSNRQGICTFLTIFGPFPLCLL
jgi:hypothetical protein